MPQEIELDFNPETGILAVDYHLPAPDDLPTLTDVKYVQSDDSFSEKHLTEGQKAKLYDELLYQVTLRTVHELFEADRVGVLRRLYSTASSHPLIAARGRRRPPAFSRFRRSAIRSSR
jgi:restriction system protein